MRRLLYLLLAAPLLLVACEKMQTPAQENATLTITSGDTMQLTHEGGVHTISYTLEGAREGALPTATCSAAWVTNIAVGDAITFAVEANEGEARMAIFVVKYGNAEQTVRIRQLSAGEAALKASYFGGIYYGSLYSPGMGNYFMHLSDNGFDASGMDKPNSKYYCLDLYAPLHEGNDKLTLPLGTYNLNTDDSAQLWTIGQAYSGYRESNEEGASLDPELYDNAKLVVEEGKATFTCTIQGKEHRVVFEGSAELIHFSDI